MADSHNNLLALKKISLHKLLNVKLQIDVPEDIQRNRVIVYLMADSYIGLDQIQRVHF